MVRDLKMNGKKIINIAQPTSSTDASTKGYVDLKVTNPGDLNLNGNKLFFDTNKTFSIYDNNNMLGLEISGFFVIRGSGNNDYIYIYYLFINTKLIVIINV